MAKDALWWAAMTYVVAALSSLATLAVLREHLHEWPSPQLISQNLLIAH